MFSHLQNKTPICLSPLLVYPQSLLGLPDVIAEAIRLLLEVRGLLPRVVCSLSHLKRKRDAMGEH